MDISGLSSILRDNGIVGAGGAGFPSYAKLNDKAETIILNCAECEPLLKLHRQLLASHADKILKAFELVRSTLGAKEAVIGVKEDYKATVEACKAQIDEYPNMRIKELANAYPMGDEVVLIYEVTGKVVRPGGLPIECGVAVFNVETMYNIYRAVYENHPVTDKLVTVAGEVKSPATFRVPIGTQISEVVKMAGGETTENPMYLLGGPMMGNFGSKFQPVTKTTSAVIVLPDNHPVVYKKHLKFSVALQRAASSCCQCRTCTDMCPRHALGHPIEPHMFMRASANHDTSDIKPYINTMFCSSCGVCEIYACPQGLSPRTMMLQYKGELRKNNLKAPIVETGDVNSSRDLRRVPEARLMARLGLTKYESPALLQDDLKDVSKVRINLSQHIGAPAVATVAQGSKVNVQDVIARAADGLSVNIHASLTGTVTEVTDKYIEITK